MYAVWAAVRMLNEAGEVECMQFGLQSGAREQCQNVTWQELLNCLGLQMRTLNLSADSS